MEDTRTHIYSNKFTISIGQSDASLTFSWVIPELNQEGSITGDKVLGSSTITMTKETLFQMRGILDELCDKVLNDGKAEQ